jgi:hypothetical protein
MTSPMKKPNRKPPIHHPQLLFFFFLAEALVRLGGLGGVVDWDDVTSSSFDISLADALFYFLNLHDPPGARCT